MRIRVDGDHCMGHSLCSALAPEVYRVTDEGFNEMGEFTVPDNVSESAEHGARACPEQAISILEDPIPQD